MKLYFLFRWLFTRQFVKIVIFISQLGIIYSLVKSVEVHTWADWNGQLYAAAMLETHFFGLFGCVNSQGMIDGLDIKTDTLNCEDADVV